jgi:hypothetical protein
MKTKLQLSKDVTMNKSDEKRQGMKVRTVVTGHDAKGRAVFVRDEKVDGTSIPGLGELAFLWNADEPATYPNEGNNPAAARNIPTRRGQPLHHRDVPAKRRGCTRTHSRDAHRG